MFLLCIISCWCFIIKERNSHKIFPCWFILTAWMRVLWAILLIIVISKWILNINRHIFLGLILTIFNHRIQYFRPLHFNIVQEFLTQPLAFHFLTLIRNLFPMDFQIWFFELIYYGILTILSDNTLGFHEMFSGYIAHISYRETQVQFQGLIAIELKITGVSSNGI